MINRYKNQKRAFSLIEVLLSFFIIAILLVLITPVLYKAKRHTNEDITSSSETFFYTNSNANSGCFVTTTNNDDETVVRNAGSCEQHEFVVPDGVYRMDITLVAGGGGGGGAAGGTIYERQFISDDNVGFTGIPLDRIKSILINALVGKGEDAPNAIEIKSGQKYQSIGGDSGAAILNHEIPSTFYRNFYTPDFPNLDVAKFNMYYNYYNTGDYKIRDLHKGTTLSGSFTKDVGEGIGLFFTENETNDFKAGIASNGNRWGNHYGQDTSIYGIYIQDTGVIKNNKKNGSDNSDERLFCYRLKPNNNKSNKFDCNVSILNGTLRGNAKKCDDDAMEQLCDITPSSVVQSIEGNVATFDIVDTKLFNFLNISYTSQDGTLFYGAKGALVPGFPKSIGGGGDGQPVMRYGGSGVVTLTGAFKPVEKWDNSSGKRYGNTTLKLENPGGIAAGGVGGAAIKLNDFPVVPGDVYTVVVGKGGTGGEAGIEGSIRNGLYRSPVAGSNGGGGSSTALYKNGKLIVMVAGGLGGNGGKINSDAIDNIPTGTDFSAYTPLAPAPDKTSNIPLVIYNGEIEKYLDHDVVTSLETVSSTDISTSPQGTAKRLKYAYIDNENSPLFELNSTNSDLASSKNISRTTSENLKKTGGFSDYNRSMDGDDSDSAALKSGKYGGINFTNTYNGLYFRNLVNGAISYPGGLGGHSGIGTRAGCGGLFVGNKNFNVGGSSIESGKTNIMLLNVAGNNTIYNIGTYYDNCSVDTADGQTADFVAPVATSSSSLSFGQAGAGGGGGGWSNRYGAGKGGDGQNGYALFSWRTK